MLTTTVDADQADVARLERHGEHARLILRRGLLADDDVADLDAITQSACRTCPAHRSWVGPQPDGFILEMSSAGVIRWASRNVGDYLGYRRDEVVGMRHTDLLDDADGSATAGRQLRERLQYQPPGTSVGSPTRRTLRAKDGRRIRLLCTSVRLVDGAILTVVQYPAGAEDGDTVIVDSDADGRVLWVSPSVTELLGWHADAIVGQLLPLTFPDDKNQHIRWLHTQPGSESRDRTPEVWMRVPHRQRGAVWMLASGVRRLDGTIRRVLRTAGDETPPRMPEPPGPPLRMAADGR